MEKFCLDGKKSLVVVDLDGTLIDFKRIDNSIISELFSGNHLVMAIDRLLWKINEFDYISNCYGVFKLRTSIYSLFSNYTKEQLMEMYGRMYIELAKDKTVSGYKYIKSLEKYGYEVIIVTHNIFAGGLSYYAPVTFALDKKRYFTKKLIKSYRIIYVVGNNYVDDIKSANLVKAHPIYVGKSKLVRRLMKNRGESVESIYQAINFIKGHHI